MGVTIMHRRASIPARINIIGEHTDYLGGLALAFASDKRLTLTVRRAEKNHGEKHVVALWEAAGGSPAHLEITSNIPIGAGMSSSAALCLAIVLCSRGRIDPLLACQEAQRIEHEVLNTPCGLLDQMAMMHATEGHATLLDFSNLETNPFELPSDWLFKLVDSGIRRDLATTTFGRSTDPSVLNAHAKEENRRVLTALDSNALALGQILNDAHASLKSIGVSHPEVDARVEELQHTPGVLGARMMGGGFGGMILVLIEHEDVLPDVPLVQSSQGGFLEELLE